MARHLATCLASDVTLNDDVTMPLFGLGTSTAVGSETERAVLDALNIGYRMIDTAQFYENESAVGTAVKLSSVDRQQVFVVSKVWNDFHGYSRTIQSVYDSLARLEMSYVDLFLIHSPGGGKLIETYQALVDLKRKGLIRSVGVSNFGIHHMEGLASKELPVPSVNQIQLHPFNRNESIAKYCELKGIAVMGYSPLVRKRKNLISDAELSAIADRHGKSVAQVLIRWSVQRGYITIPKSANKDRIVENSAVFDFTLSEDEMKLLNSKPSFSIAEAWNPVDLPWEG